MNDLRYAVRTLRGNPSFALVTVLLLSLGIGANCVIFSALDAVMLRRLPVRHPEELVRLVQNLPNLPRQSYVPYSVYTGLRQRSTVLSDIFGHEEMNVAMSEPGPPERIRVHLVTDNFFAALGVDALYGRVLRADDTQAAVLSYGFWRRRWSGDARVIGSTIRLHGYPFVIVGVLPNAFNGLSIDTAPDVRVPLSVDPLFSGRDRDLQLDFTAGRLKPGVTRQQAAGEISAIWRPLMANSAESYQAQWQLDKGLELDSLEHGVSKLREQFSAALVLLVAGVGLLLLIVCANVAGLLLARSASRQQEIVVRLALGATRGRLIRQMLTESFLLAVAGGMGGTAIAFASTPLLTRALPPIRDLAATTLPLALHIEPNLRALAFSLALCVLTTLLFGLAPAIQASRTDLHSSLRAVRATRGWRGRQALVVFEIALCTLLLAGAGLLGRTFQQLHRLDAGFDRDHIVTFTTDPGVLGYTPEKAASLRNSWMEKVRVLPGVRSAAGAAVGVMHGTGIKTTVALTGHKITPADFLNASLQVISPEYFETMGMQLTGRAFGPADEVPRKSRRPVIVNQAFARRFFPGEAAIGRTFGGGMNKVADDASEIVGVATDAKYRSIREPIPATIYQPYLGDPTFVDRFVLHVRTYARPESIIQPVREILRSLDPQLPLIEVHTLAEEVDASLWSERLTAALASIFGALAALLAAVGIYGLLAYAVTQRAREIGIRMSLGATPANILGLIGSQAGILAVGGIALGLAGVLGAGPAVRSVLYGVAPADVPILTFTALSVAVIAVGATAIPILHAVRVDPASALRIEK